MQNTRKPKQQSYLDGLAKIYKLKDMSGKGEAPRFTTALKAILPFAEKSVGYARQYAAQAVAAKVDMLIETREVRAVAVHDVVCLTGHGLDADEQYTISQITWLADTEPPVMRLTLGKTTKKYQLEDGTQ